MKAPVILAILTLLSHPFAMAENIDSACDLELLQGTAQPLPKTESEVVAFDVVAAVRKNFSLYLNTSRIQSDWNQGVPMLYPKVGSVLRLRDVPSEFGRENIYDRSGHAMFPLRAFDPIRNGYRDRLYPVVRLNPQTGNPVILLQPHSHIFVPSITSLNGEADPYVAPSANMTAVTAENPVRVRLYNGEMHQEQLVQLVVTGGHRRLIAAKRRSQAVYVEVTGFTGYKNPLLTWEELDSSTER